MPIEPDKDARYSVDDPELPGEVERERADIGVVSILSVIALLVGIGLWYYASHRELVASDGTTVPQTTGAASQEQPDAPRQSATPPQQ